MLIFRENAAMILKMPESVVVQSAILQGNFAIFAGF